MVNIQLRKMDAIGRCLYVRTQMEVKLEEMKTSLSKERIEEAETKIGDMIAVEAFIYEMYTHYENIFNRASVIHKTTLDQALEIRALKEDNEKMSNTLKQFVL